jgi:(E)-4-hydroxy-3-methylbut-2-enyl-diphosphate synthase
LEVEAAKIILKSLGLRDGGIEVVSCPTCARCKINLIPIAKEVNERLENCDKKLKVAVMGCVVNGPGEARDADIGIAGGDGCAMLFKKGEIVKKVAEEDIVDELLKLIEFER